MPEEVCLKLTTIYMQFWQAPPCFWWMSATATDSNQRGVSDFTPAAAIGITYQMARSRNEQTQHNPRKEWHAV